MHSATMGTVKTLQVRNVPETTHRELRTRAAAAGMSMSDYVLEELNRLAATPPMADVLRRAAARSGGTTREAIVDAVRSGRDRD